MNTMKWLLKREFWEHKGAFFWAPAILGMVMVAVTGITIVYGMGNGASFTLQVSGRMQDMHTMVNSMSAQDHQQLVRVLSNICLGAGLPLLMMLTVTTFFYCLGALHDERRDRSILFWKSLPLSDTQTVLSKVLMATLGAPVIVIGISLATSLALLLIIGMAALFYGVNVFTGILGNEAVYMLPLRALGVLPVYLLCALPTAGWLLMVSAWARSKPFLWGVGVPLIALILVKWVGYVLGMESGAAWLMNNVARRMLMGLAPGSWLFDHSQGGTMPHEPGVDVVLQAWSTLASPGLWIGAAGGVLMIYAAIRLRRFKDEG
jgi:ABC-2 type transport system permease protein